MEKSATPDCAFFWEADIYIYQASKPKISFSNLFDQMGLFNKKQKEFENKAKLWKCPCHIELHQMQLYIRTQENNFIIKFDDQQTVVSLIEMNMEKSKKELKQCPLLYIKINKNILDNNQPIKYSDDNDETLQNPTNKSANKTNSKEEDKNQNFQIINLSNNFYDNGRNNNFIYCDNYNSNNEIILTADDEEAILQLFVSIKSAFLNNEIISINDFKFISTLGRGNFGKVSLVEYNSHPGELYALKSINKINIVKNGSIKSVLRERNVLSCNKYQFIVSLKFSFQTATKYYIGLEYISGGDLRNCINKSFGLTSQNSSKLENDGNNNNNTNNNGKIKYVYIKSDNENDEHNSEDEKSDNYNEEIKKSFDDKENHQLELLNMSKNLHNENFHITFKDVQIYVAEISLALHYLHSNGVVYRDLKPENVMICEDGHIKLTDFGLALQIGPNGSSRSLCGTLKYIAPEVIVHSKYSFPVDWWSLGIVVYELIFTQTPFNDKSRNQLFNKILKEPVQFPKINTTSNTDKNVCEYKLNALEELKLNGFCSGLNGSVVDYDSIKDFIRLLLAKNQKRRLIFGQDFVNHPFWGGLNFDDIAQKKFSPSFIPSCRIGIEHFNDKFTNMKADDSEAELPVGHKSVCVNGFSFFGSSFELNKDNCNNNND